MDLFSSELKFSVGYAIGMMLPNLMTSDKELITKLSINILKIAGYCHGFGETSASTKVYLTKLSQNNYKDIRWMIGFLLPYLDEQRMNRVTSFDQIYREKESNVDINLEQPRYVYSNIQFNRCERHSDGKYYEIPFVDKYMMDKYHLLIDSILRSRYKLCVNWIDIVPIINNQYNELPVYRNTMDLYKTKNIKSLSPRTVDQMIDNMTDPLNNRRLNSIGLDEIYNTLSLNLYEQIVPCKWMIFDIVIDVNGNDIPSPLIIILHNIISLTNCLHNINWLDCTEKEQKQFTKEWKTIIGKIEKKQGSKSQSARNNTFFGLSPQNHLDIIRPIVMYFDRMYSGILLARAGKDSYIPIENNILSETEDLYDQEDLNALKWKNLMKSLNSIAAIHIYEFFKESLQVLKTTWYGGRLITTTKDNLMEFIGLANTRSLYNYDQSNDPRDQVTYKNVYNYCKSFVHQTEGKQYIRMGRYFSELSPEYVRVVEQRINRSAAPIWFNIRGNLKNVFRFQINEKDKKRLNELNADRYTTISDTIIDVVFEQKTSSGTFSQMIDANHFTDNLQYDLQNNAKKEQLMIDLAKERMFPKNTPYRDANYYMTNRPFKELGVYDMQEGKGRNIQTKQYNYFDWLIKYKWNTGAAYHWVAQLGFINHHINNRVTFLTAGTGVGKSTEIPKLYCYYLKALDHIPNPTVLITVPRTSIIQKTAFYVAECMGTPLKRFDDDASTYIATNNFSIQYKYRENNHRESGFYPTIIFTTDGSFPLEAVDPTMKKKSIDVVEGKRTFHYTNKNTYDMILVDEAHEHNQNMDLILTLMRNTCLLNNMIKLVIISATIDADEPIYRRYYREIDDNMKYPYNRLLDTEGLDRVNVDRRCNIQIPGQRTQFPIRETYLPNGKILEIIQEICRTTVKKNILVFQSGQGDIKKLLRILNKPNNLPDDMLAVPFYSEMENKGIVEDLENKIGRIRMDKTESFEETKDLTIGSSYYNRFVMVATNIAEASLTIDLDYVVDAGKQKTLIYDYDKRGGKIIEGFINEASRLQRKGRVGRIAPGNIYYLYPENSLVGNVKQFNIAISDIHISALYEYLRELDETPLLNPTIDRIIRGIDTEAVQGNTNDTSPNNTAPQTFAEVERRIWEEYIIQFLNIHHPKIIIDRSRSTSIRQIAEQIIANKLADNILEMSRHKANKISKSLNGDAQILFDIVKPYILNSGEKNTSIIRMIRSQYFIQNQVIRKYSTTSTPPLYPSLYSTGYDSERLNDREGTFYIIHPEELVIRRNIAGVPIKSIDSSVVIRNHLIESKKIVTFWETLLNKCFIETTKNSVGKSLLGETFLEVMKIISLPRMDETGFQFIAWGILLLDEQEINDLFYILAFLTETKNNVRGIFNSDLRKRPLDQKLKMFADPKSDLMTIRNIVKTCEKIFKNEGILTDYRDYIRKYEPSSYKEMVLYEMDGVKNDNYVTERKKLLKQLIDKNALHFYNDRRVEEILNHFNINLKKYAKLIFAKNILMCDYIEYKFEIVKNAANSKKIKIDNLEQTKLKIRPLYDYLHNNLDMTPIDAIFLWTRPYSVYKKIPQTPSQYISLFNPYGDSIYAPMSVNPFRQIVASTIDHMNMGEYLFALFQDPNTYTLNILCRVTPKDLQLLSNIYNPLEMSRKYFKKDPSISAVEQKITEIQENDRNIENNLEKKVIYDPISLSERVHGLSIARTMARSTYDNLGTLSSNSKIWKILTTIHPNYSDYAKIITDGKIE